MNAKGTDDLSNVSWLTAEGFLDPGKFPIDSPLRQCVSPRSEEFRTGCTLLGTMVSHGRVEAGIFLLGLLRYCGDDVTALAVIVESLGRFQDARSVSALFGELLRVPSSNRTRRYLDTVIRTLTQLPAEMVQERFRELAEAPSFSPRMRAKFAAAAEAVVSHR